MNNEPIILNEVGAAILAYEEDWNKHCQEVGLESPLQKRMKIFNERLRPSLDPHGKPRRGRRELVDMTEE